MKIILAVVPNGEDGLATLETAFGVGRDLTCHVRVLHVRPDPTISLLPVGEAISGALVDEVIKACANEGAARAAKVRTLFDQVASRCSIPLVDGPLVDRSPANASASYDEAVGQEDDVVVLRGRTADMIVCGRPLDKPPLQATLEAALMESGRPVLLAPPEPIHDWGETVMIAWNGSSQAAGAVTAAMPFLSRAKRVIVSVVAESKGSLAEDMLTYLAWHGIKAESQHMDAAAHADVGAFLLRSCSDHAATLLVMGAYTHSRLRQWIFGGTTRHVLDHASIPVLLSH